jgi:two-component system sensor histidine kinase UhpB
LLVFCLAMAVVAWLAAHRALKPVRVLEQGLARIGQGEHPVAMPRLELREFASIARCIEQLADDLAQARQSEQHLARQLLELQEAERRELARELHDEFGQALTAINISAAFIEKHARHAGPEALVASAQDIRGEAARMLAQVRGLLSQLRPHGLEGLQMVDALNDLVSSWRGRAPEIGIEAEFPPSLPTLPPLAGLALYRTLQEALTNVLRHSVASRVRLSLECCGRALELSVSDNGVGRGADVLRKARGGLLGMRERAEMAGGSCWLVDGPDGGLQVRLRLPIQV